VNTDFCVFSEAVQRLRHADLEGVVRAAGELAAIDEAEELPFPPHVLESLRALIGSDVASYTELDRPADRVIDSYAVPDDGGEPRHHGPDEAAIFWQLKPEHPWCAYADRTLDFSPRLLSEFVTPRELRNRQFYTDWLRPLGVEHQICVGLPAPLTHTKVFLFDNGSKTGDFGGRELTIVALLRPHLVRRYEELQTRRLADAALAALETTDEALVLLDEAGHPAFPTARARRLLAGHGFDVADVPLVAPLVARPIRRGVLLLEEARPLGLTPREREILALVAEGHTNAQIARTLWISPATVGKHLENSYAKLGVASRTAAVRRIAERGTYEGWQRGLEPPTTGTTTRGSTN
jgi:DNA-binding CsgD family transcriptional regulator